MHTPYGIDAVLTLAIPAEHAWHKPCRVQDLSPGMEIHLPQEAGWLSKRVESARVKLDRLFVSAVALEASRAAIQLRKNAASGQALPAHGRVRHRASGFAHDPAGGRDPRG